MALLIAGLVVWCLVHAFPALAPAHRAELIAKMGNGYKGLFALLIISSVVMMVFGWRSITPTDLYQPMANLAPVTAGLVVLTFILFAAAKMPTNIKRFLRHPQLTGLVLWGAGHLLTNGDDRSVVLFSTLTVWALLEMWLINRRDGAWVKPESMPLVRDLIPVVAGIVVYIIFKFLHVYITGVSLM